MAPEDEAARGVAVEPMREGGPARQAEAQRVEIVLEARPAFRPGMDGDAGGLVENEHHPVSVDEPRACFFWGHGEKWYASVGRARIARCEKWGPVFRDKRAKSKKRRPLGDSTESSSGLGALKEVLWRWTKTKRNPASCAAGSEARRRPRRRTRRRPRTRFIPRPAPRPLRASPRSRSEAGFSAFAPAFRAPRRVSLGASPTSSPSASSTPPRSTISRTFSFRPISALPPRPAFARRSAA